jgi:anaerobic selenocysteine-containing dehydrogenase
MECGGNEPSAAAPGITPTLQHSNTPSFIVSTRRGKQFNTLIYAEIDPLNGAPRDAVLMSADDAAALRLIHGDRVVLRNELGTYAARVHLAPIARGNLQVHWPEANHLIPRGIVDAGGGVPDYNMRVTIEKAA